MKTSSLLLTANRFRKKETEKYLSGLELVAKLKEEKMHEWIGGSTVSGRRGHLIGPPVSD